MKIVILQPQFFPWIGVFEQIRLADVYVHYDDVQFPQGRSFMNRVQIKSRTGSQWLTAPVLRKGSGKQIIKEVVFDNSRDWRSEHLKTLRHNYAAAPFVEEMIGIVADVYKRTPLSPAETNIAAIEMISEYFGLQCRFLRSSTFDVRASGSEKLIKLVLLLEGTVYITGHGARNYLDHELFEKNGVRVEYADYRMTPYPQLHGSFDPYVSILDLIANRGRAGAEYIHSGSKYWREFING